MDKVILLTKDKLYFGPNKYDWDFDSLSMVLTELKEKFKVRKAGLLLGDDLVYLFCVRVEVLKGDKKLRDLVAEKLAEVVPEKVDHLSWDYKEILNEEGKVFVQVMAMSKEFIKGVSVAFRECKIDISFTEPFSYSLSRATKNKDEKKIILHLGEFENVFVFAGLGYVYYAQLIKGQDTQSITKEIIDYLDYVKAKYSTKDGTKVILSNGQDKVDANEISKKGFVIENEDINFVEGLFRRREIKGKDEEVLNIETKNLRKKVSDNGNKKGNHSTFSFLKFFKKNKRAEADAEGEDGKKGGSNRLPLMIAILAVLVIIAIVLVLNRDKTSKVAQTTDTQPIASVEETPPSEVEEGSGGDVEEKVQIDYSLYKVNVLNGSGISGEAGRVRDLIDKLGFKKVDVGNANSYSYVVTEIHFKEGVPVNVIEKLVELMPDYQVEIINENLGESAPYDIEIIVGSEK